MSKINNENRSTFFPNKRGNGVEGPDRSAFDRDLPLNRNSPDKVQELNQNTKSDVKVQIPDAVKDFARIKKAVDMAPEVNNEEKIQSLKNQIKNGTYEVNYEALANRILEQEFN